MNSSLSHLQIDLPASGEQYCPHLGLKDDAQTCVGFPSSWNLCHHCQPVRVVHLKHQRHVCLTNAYLGCPVFQTMEKISMPPHLRFQDE